MSEQLYTDKTHTEQYRAYRPNYPKEIYEHIADYYFHGKARDGKIPTAVDVACGSGQAAADLSLLCERVIGIDVSENQIANAIQRENIEYRCTKGEDLSFLLADSVDLITVATALHWLDLNQFFGEVKRVLKPQTGVLAIWTYGHNTLDNIQANDIYHRFHYETLSSYWDRKVFSIGDCYQSISARFPYQSTLRQYNIERQAEMTIDDLLGYIQTTSGCQTFRKEKGEQIYQDTLNSFRQKLVRCYIGEDQAGDGGAIKVAFSRPMRLYLMRKTEGK